MHADRPPVATAPDAHEQLLERFLAALSDDDAPALLALLAPQVALASDGGGRARAARNWLIGANRVCRFLLGISRKLHPGAVRRLTRLNGQPALLTFEGGRLTTAKILDVENGRIRAVHIMRNPEKLRHVLTTVGPIA